MLTLFCNLSCSTTPQAVITELPVNLPAALENLIKPEELDRDTAEVLRENGLERLYRKNPGQAIRELEAGLRVEDTKRLRRAVTELCFDSAENLEESDPRQSVGFYLAAASSASSVPAFHQVGEDLSRDQLIYNLSTTKVATLCFESGWISGNHRFQGPLGDFILTLETAGDHTVENGFFDELLPAEYLSFKGLENLDRKRQPGIGAAMVGHRNRTDERFQAMPFLSYAGMSLPLTATLQFADSGPQTVLRFHDCASTSQFALGRHTLPLAIDHTAPFASHYNYLPEKNLGFDGLLHPDHYIGDSDLFLLKPYRPDQIPVVLVHGLLSSPETWIHAVNELNADPVLRDKFQLLLYYYPTGYPIAYNAELLRQSLERFQAFFDPQRTNPNMRNMVLIGHSMGGILSNLQVRDSGDIFEREIFTVPVDELSISQEKKNALHELMTFTPNPDITRVVFVATPHRGSELADSILGRLGAALIGFSKDTLQVATIPDLPELTDYGRILAHRKTNSVRNLHAHGHVLEEVLTLPLGEHVSYHSIIGNHENQQPVEDSTDTVVPYWSSSLDGAGSEHVVDATHTSITRQSATLEEIRRILYRHLGLPDPE